MGKPNYIIFIVDDDESVRKALERLLGSVGLNVETFTSAEEFLKCEHYQAPDLLILDVRMPGMSGLGLQKHLLESSFNVPIIFITGHYDDDNAHEIAIANGAAAFLEKPVHGDIFLKKIKNILNLGIPKESNHGVN